MVFMRQIPSVLYSVKGIIGLLNSFSDTLAMNLIFGTTMIILLQFLNMCLGLN